MVGRSRSTIKTLFSTISQVPPKIECLRCLAYATFMINQADGFFHFWFLTVFSSISHFFVLTTAFNPWNIACLSPGD